MRKRLYAAILAICMIVSLTACGTASAPAEDAAAGCWKKRCFCQSGNQPIYWQKTYAGMDKKMYGAVLTLVF